MPQRLYLQLENGEIFEGFAFGADLETEGEIVFATSMTGYCETLTDKSFDGQIVVQTFPLIGNYGVIPADFEAEKIYARGYIVKEWCRDPSNFRSGGDLDTFLKSRNIPGLYGIDTRKLTRMLREKGVMNGILTKNPGPEHAERIRAYRVGRAVARVSVKERRVENPEGSIHVAFLDFGYKESILRHLVERGCRVTVCPHDTSFEELRALDPDGVMLSNGPGDPKENPEVIAELRKLLASGIPVFGICLGHQLMALAAGAETVKLKYGHRGANQPAKNLASGRVYITSQNHGYCVKSETVPSDAAKVSWVNVNDGTCEGLDYLKAPVFSVQFHPEAGAGPLDTEFLFDRFLNLIRERKGDRFDAAR